MASLQPEQPLADPGAIEAAPGDCPRGHSPTFERICEKGLFPEVCADADPPRTRVICSSAGAPIRMAATASHLDLPGRLGFTIVNGTDRALATNFYHWHLYKRVDGDWYNVAPSAHPSPLHMLEPGDLHHYCVSMDNTSAADRHLRGLASPTGSTNRSRWHLSVPALGGGEYAFGLFGTFDGAGDDDRETGAIARFSLGGDPVEVTRTGLVENVSREGDLVTGDWTYERDADVEAVHEFELGRIGPDRDRVRLLPETLLRNWARSPLRDMIALSTEYDADVVRLRAWNYAAVSMAPPYVPFEYDGRGYETSVREL